MDWAARFPGVRAAEGLSNRRCSRETGVGLIGGERRRKSTRSEILIGLSNPDSGKILRRRSELTSKALAETPTA